MVFSESTNFPNTSTFIEMIDARLLGNSCLLDQMIFNVVNDLLGRGRSEILDRTACTLSINLLSDTERRILTSGRPNKHKAPQSSFSPSLKQALGLDVYVSIWNQVKLFPTCFSQFARRTAAAAIAPLVEHAAIAKVASMRAGADKSDQPFAAQGFR